jgi:hypothetical protein
LIGDGHVAARFAPSVTPDPELRAVIDRELDKQ